MEIVPLSSSTLDKAIHSLLNKNVIAFPSDTVYGALALLDRETAEILHTVRQRPREKPFLIIIPESLDIEEYLSFTLTEEQKQYTLKKWPGRNTLIFQKHTNFWYPFLNSTIALRKPKRKDNPFFYELVQIVNKPILAPSLNLPGHSPLSSINDIKATFEGQIPYLFWDSNFIPSDTPSQIWNLTKYPFIQER